MAEKTAEQLMADVVAMYSDTGTFGKLYQQNKAQFMANTLGQLGPGMVNTTKPAAIGAAYEKENALPFAAQMTGLKATAMTNLAGLLEARNTLDKQLSMQKYLTELGISSQEQMQKYGIASQEKLAADSNALNLKLAEMGITSQEKLAKAQTQAGLQTTGMQVASNQGINAANIASGERTNTANIASNQAINAANIAAQYGTKYPANSANPVSSSWALDTSGYNAGNKLTQPTGYQAYQTFTPEKAAASLDFLTGGSWNYSAGGY